MLPVPRGKPNHSDSRLDDEDLSACHKLLSRGLHFYKRISKTEYMKKIRQIHYLPEICFNVRALAELSTGIHTWTSSLENIKLFSSNAILDHADFVYRQSKQIDSREDLGSIDEERRESLQEVLKKGRKYYERIGYNGGTDSVDVSRRRDDLFANTLVLTSKVIHQDEYSVVGMQLTDALASHVLHLADFWKFDFEGEVYFLNRRFPEVILYCTSRGLDLPFDYHKLP